MGPRSGVLTSHMTRALKSQSFLSGLRGRTIDSVVTPMVDTRLRTKSSERLLRQLSLEPALHVPTRWQSVGQIATNGR